MGRDYSNRKKARTFYKPPESTYVFDVWQEITNTIKYCDSLAKRSFEKGTVRSGKHLRGCLEVLIKVMRHFIKESKKRDERIHKIRKEVKEEHNKKIDTQVYKFPL